MAGTSEDTEGGGADGVRNNADVTSRIAGRTTGVDPSVGASTVARPGGVASNLSGARAATVPGAKPAATTGTGAKTTGLTSTTLPAVKTTAPPKTTLTSTGSGVKAGTTTGTTTGTAGVKTGLTGTPKLTSTVGNTSLTSTGSGVKAGTTTGTTGVKAGTTGVPKLTSTVGNTSLTSTGSGVKTGTTTGKTLPGVKTTTRSNTGSTIGNALTGALTGAALGVGTKAIIDKLTGGTKTNIPAVKTTNKTTTDGTGTPANAGPGGTPKKSVTTGPGLTVPKLGPDGRPLTAVSTLPPLTSTLKDARTTAVTPKTPVAKPFTPPKLGGTNVPTVKDKVGPTVGKPVVPKAGGPGTPNAKVTNTGNDGRPIEDDSSRAGDTDREVVVNQAAAYDDDGNLMPGYEEDENGNPVWVGTDAPTKDAGVAYDDEGNLLPGYEEDENGNPIFVGTDDAANGATLDTLDGETLDGGLTRGLTLSADGAVAADDDVEEGPQYLMDEAGNYYDLDQNLIMYADGSAPDQREVAFTDQYGNTYDADENLIEEGDHSDWVSPPDEFGATFDWFGEPVTEGDYSSWRSEPDEYGNTYDFAGDLVGSTYESDPDEFGGTTDWFGNVVKAADYSSYVSDPDEFGRTTDWYGEEVTPGNYGDGSLYDYSEDYGGRSLYDYSEDYGGGLDFDDDGEPGKKGGLFKVGGSNESGVEDTVISEDPIDEVTNEDGTTTQTFADGSVITYDANYNATVDDDNYTRIGDTFTGNIRPVSNSRMMSNFEDRGPGEEIPEVMQRQPQDLEPDDAPIGNTPPEGWPAGFVSNYDGTATYFDDDGSTVTIDVDNSIVSVTDANGEIVAQDGEPVGDFAQGTQGNRQYLDDGSSIETFDDGSQIVYDSDGNVFKAVDQYETTYDDEGNAIVTDGYGNIVSVYDPQGNVIPLGGGRETGPTSITGGGGTGFIDTTRDKTPAELRAERIAAGRESAETKSALDKILESIGGSGYLGAGAAGAVLGGLLGNSSLFDSGPASTNGFDMSQVGNIDPRTTDFGIGPARYVGYDQYGAPEQMPELYGKELYQNLNAPGFNEVNPGDYAAYDRENEGPYPDQTIPEYSTDPRGYYPMPEYSTEPEYNPDENGENSLQTFDMADGGEVQPQPGMNTFYTFGKTVDPLENLRNPQPFQPAPPTQQNPGAKPPMGGLGQQMPQQMPQMPQMPPQQMPQQMPQQPMQKPPGLRSGGLPAWSNVPLTQGRLNFRQGAAVHGAGDGQSDDIPAMLADGEYVIDADTVAQIGNGSTKAGAAALDKFRENIRSHKRAAPVNQIPPKTRALTSYLKGVK